MDKLTNHEALEIAHSYGITVRQFGADFIRANLEQANGLDNPARYFDKYMADAAFEAGCESAQAAELYAQERG